MSNAEHRLKNEEVGIRVLTQIALQKVHCTWYKVFLLDTNYLILFSNVECRTPIEEGRSGANLFLASAGLPTAGWLLKALRTLYLACLPQAGTLYNVLPAFFCFLLKILS